VKLALQLAAFTFRIFQATTGLFQLLGKLVFDVLEVIQLDFLVVDLLQQLVVLVLETLALLGQIVDVLVQVLNLIQQVIALGFKAFGSFLGGVLKHLGLFDCYFCVLFHYSTVLGSSKTGVCVWRRDVMVPAKKGQMFCRERNQMRPFHIRPPKYPTLQEFADSKKWNARRRTKT
jgi:hypothetical protein